MVMKKKIFAFCMTALLLFSFTVNAFAATVTLPDGGSTKNTGVDRVLGRTSGGKDGYANIYCVLVAYQGSGDVNDYVIDKISSDVPTIKKAYSIVNIYYYTYSGSYECVSNEGYAPAMLPFSIRANANSQNAIKATSGHSATFETRGTWVCGNTVHF